MLTIQCTACNGAGDNKFVEGKGWTQECKACFNGYVDAPEDMKVYVSVYKVTREFGGHEEGGWWFDWYKCLETIPCKNKFSDEIKEDLLKEYNDVKHGDISFVLGGADVQVFIERRPAENETRERPMYE
ncbi:hypothetical protein [Bacillus gaemokensis]|uniref:Uncharacterized protein n=1 Tax=Bacillus gaemokensis TaxID=574375 RepID=A0A073K991_9BACI|nr:hypothetical protein [Bacillus gaemokensis]KEK23859.1 hypothetical protein BAGA_05285 [Bacillus gaemokensis]KYG38099.1 hypothetical protein AZF08_20325 [Bacillus gaemokensis]